MYDEVVTGNLPRLRAHIILIHWYHASTGEWQYETITGQFVGGTYTTWSVTTEEAIREFDMNTWARCIE